MIHVEESFTDERTVLLRIEGRLDRESFPAFRAVCQRHLEAGRRVRLDMGGLNHIGQDGREFVRSIRKRVRLQGLSEYLKLAIDEYDVKDDAR
ncbi:MAG: hypothetical protein KKB20_13115 [Proteobacteria bacterium]|nr:hypothetical protein [Pseudomonadota bacterium]